MPSTRVAAEIAGSNKPKPARRVIPEALPVPAAVTATAITLTKAHSVQSTHSMQSTHSRGGNASFGLKRCHSESEAQSFSTAAASSQVRSVMSASSDEVGSQSGVGTEGDEEEDLEDVSGKMLTEFGSRGDLWWEDFIAAKEEMLTDVLQVSIICWP